jgi:peptidoglycan/LPS O-acetylase OafA/YrhL
MHDYGNPHLIFIYSTQVPSMLDAFAIGICIARLHLDGTIERWSKVHRALPALAAACVFAVALYFGWKVYWAHANYWGNAWMVIFWRTALALTFGALVLLAAQLPDMTRVWPLRPLYYLGEVSYGIYLWHLPVILALKPLSAIVSPERVLVMTLLGVVTLSALTWHLFEKPMIRRFR